MQDLIADLKNAVYTGNAQLAKTATEQLLKLGYSTEVIIQKALFAAMDDMGKKMKNREIYVPEVLMASRAMHASMYVLRPLMSHYRGKRKGVVVIGTVAGDLHDIGKNLVAMMLESDGFLVIDMGIDVTKEEFLQALVKYKPDILCMSALLTTTISEMKGVIDAIVDAGMRPQIKIMVGGMPVTAEYAREIHADIYTSDMFEAVEGAEDLINNRIGKYAV